MPLPKHVQVYQRLRDAIVAGKYRRGDRVPTELELVEQWDASRPTVARALNRLEETGFVRRRAGSGTYVTYEGEPRGGTRLFGLLIPELGQTEIFEAVCGQIAREAQRHRDSLLWGDFGDSDPEARARLAERACADIVKRKLSGVFFAPIELRADHHQTNQRILDTLAEAGVPVVLLDRDVVGFPDRSGLDLVGLDNLRAGYLLGRHLAGAGWRRVGFLARAHSAPTVSPRVTGVREALRDARLEMPADAVLYGDPEDAGAIRRWLRKGRLDAVVAANDLTAARLLHTLDALKVRVPRDLAVVGFDDVKYARLVRVPLTTIHQPCADIGRAAFRAMLDRVEAPDLPPRTVLLSPRLVVRKSSGAKRPGRKP